MDIDVATLWEKISITCFFQADSMRQILSNISSNQSTEFFTIVYT